MTKLVLLCMALATAGCTSTHRSNAGTFVSDVELRGEALEVEACALEYVKSTDHLDGWDFLIALATLGLVDGHKDQEQYLERRDCTRHAEVLP